ncbi:golgin subfamily A member 6-like protein 22 isoform X5 [Stegostoma tigrinum]|uniref:golgin subfamily A member 6-like protein 22 isoform X5 n=1 Tax=Stegostoma tigrinum TaxID=3053191 RepID=UPI002870AE6B|nr:golgin subfamily A member 6-like protein 22 isoform X5 [Stegostoma tigrinum]
MDGRQTKGDRESAWNPAAPHQIPEGFGHCPVLGSSCVREMPSVVSEPLQLVHMYQDSLLLNEDAFRRCFFREDVKDRLVSVISIIGAERKGKSFLLNYLLRRLSNPKCEDQSWMGKQNEDLKGFEYRRGTKSTTKGVFIWSEPFLMDTEDGKMAVYLVDTEGCDSHQRQKSRSVQLSALSMLLSSHMIFNVASKISKMDLEYLEMFLDMAQRVGEVLELDPTQHLDILVRDWDQCEDYGKCPGKEYLEEVQTEIQNSECQYTELLLKQLSKCECFLMPNPGKKIRTSSTGHWQEMDEDFRNSLDGYFSSVLRSLSTSARKDKEGSFVSGSQFFERIKLFTKTIERHSKHITSPLQMMNAVLGMKLREKMREDFQDFFSSVEEDDDDISVILKTSPISMRNRLEVKADELREEFKQKLEVSEEQRESEVMELDSLLKKETENFCKAYTKQFNSAIVKLSEKMLKEFECFIKQQEEDDDDISVILKTSPIQMRNRLEVKADELREEFKQKLEVSEEQRESEVMELDSLLKKETENFCKAYTKQFNSAIVKLSEKMLKEFECFIKQQQQDNTAILETVKTTPESMRKCLDEKAQELVKEFRSQLLMSEGVDDGESEKGVTELEECLNKTIEEFCSTYGNTFASACDKLRRQKLKEFKSFIDQQDFTSDAVILRNSPSSVRNHLDRKRRELSEDFHKFLSGYTGDDIPDPEQQLQEMCRSFLRGYEVKFNEAVSRKTKEKVKELTRYYKHQTDSRWKIMRKTSKAMREILGRKASALTEEATNCVTGNEEEKRMASEEIQREMREEMDTLCEDYDDKRNQMWLDVVETAVGVATTVSVPVIVKSGKPISGCVMLIAPAGTVITKLATQRAGGTRKKRKAN